MDAYRAVVQTVGIDLGPAWEMAMTAANPALAGPGSARVEVPERWQPGL